MKKFSLFLVMLFLTKNAFASVTIVACEAEWASLAREIVGNKAQVFTIAKANENPSDLSVSTDMKKIVRSADMMFCSGNGIEDKWLSMAINKAPNLVVLTRKENLLFAYDYAPYKSTASRVHLNPHNITAIAAEFTRRIKIIDGLNEHFYQKSYENFLSRWQKSIAIWEKVAQPLSGMRVVIQSEEWKELLNWLNLEVAVKIPPQATRLDNVKMLEEALRILKEKPAQAIIFSLQEDKKPALWLSEKSRTRMVLLPSTVGSAANSADLFQMFSTIINLLLADCSKVLCPAQVGILAS